MSYDVTCTTNVLFYFIALQEAAANMKERQAFVASGKRGRGGGISAPPTVVVPPVGQPKVYVPAVLPPVPVAGSSAGPVGAGALGPAAFNLDMAIKAINADEDEEEEEEETVASAASSRPRAVPCGTHTPRGASTGRATTPPTVTSEEENRNEITVIFFFEPNHVGS